MTDKDSDNSHDTRDAKPQRCSYEYCPVCGTQGIPQRAKLVCPNCRIIIETCCEGSG